MKSYDTLSEALNQLRKEGYTIDFNLKQNGLFHEATGAHIQHHEFVVDKYYRFEGMTDPADEAILYAISSSDHQLKGVLVNGYGMYSDALTNEMIAKLNDPLDHAPNKH
jgi:Fe2+ or Zn2+ uptake regulation protein